MLTNKVFPPNIGNGGSSWRHVCDTGDEIGEGSHGHAAGANVRGVDFAAVDEGGGVDE
jgi:hypothetical protein